MRINMEMTLFRELNRLVNAEAITAEAAREAVVVYRNERDIDSLIACILSSDFDAEKMAIIEETLTNIENLKEGGPGNPVINENGK